MRNALLTVCLLGVVACSKDNETTDSGDVSLVGPEMSHAADESTYFEGDALALAVEAADEQGVAGIDVFFRLEGSTYWENRPLEDGADGWAVELPGADVQKPGVEYYFRAVDMGEPSAVSYLPLEAADAPFSVTVKPRGAALPFVADFEYEGLYQSGWVNVAAGFQGNPWEISALQAYGGSQSVVHVRGLEDIDPMDDYLISPALDLSQVAEAQVSWLERGSSINEGLSASLWISTGSRDPVDGDFVLVEELELAENAVWRRSDVINLSEWAGEAEVYLAWRYAGQNAGDWFLDDITVKELSCDAKMSLAWTPNPVHPGEDGTLTVHVDNPVEASCADVSVGLSVDPAVGTLDQATVDAGELPAQGSTQADFVLSIDQEWPDNTYVPVDVTVTADGDVFIETLILTVGQASEARLSMDLMTDGLVQLSLGVGDPDAPEWEELLYASTESAGVLELSFDITEKEPYLGPAPGTQRWWARIYTEADLSVDQFEIDFGDTTYAASILPIMGMGQESLVYIPEPPEPVLVGDSTSPNPVAPGDSVSLWVDLYNMGAVTAGQTTATLSSSHPSVSITAPGPVDVGSGLWSGGESRTISDSFGFDVDAGHVDSTDLSFEVLLDDGVEQWTLPLDVAVPWPVMKIMAIRIDDSATGDGDGLLEPGETADLEFDILNAGDLDATGMVVANLAIGTSSTASATTPGTSDTLGTMQVGTDRTANFQVTVDASSTLGDTLLLELDFADSVANYQSNIEVVLGELPWLPLSSADDAAGDSNGYGFDILNAHWRTDGVTMGFRFEAAAPFDQTKDYAEAWMVSAGGDYQFYRLMLQGSTARLQGYDSGFINLPQPTLTFPDATHAILEWNIADMGQLTTNNLSVGLGAGWCQVDTGSFCDHFPNGWGYYYHSTYSTFGFFPISW